MSLSSEQPDQELDELLVQVIKRRAPRQWPRLVLKGTQFRIEQYKDGSFGGYVRGHKFDGLRSERQAIIWCLSKLDEF